MAARRKVDPKPDDPYRGVYTDDRDVEHLLSEAGRISRRPIPDAALAAAYATLSDQAAALRGAGARYAVGRPG